MTDFDAVLREWGARRWAQYHGKDPATIDRSRITVDLGHDCWDGTDVTGPTHEGTIEIYCYGQPVGSASREVYVTGNLAEILASGDPGGAVRRG